MSQSGSTSKRKVAKVLIAPWHRPSLANMARLYSLFSSQERLRPCLLSISDEITKELRSLVGDSATIYDYQIDHAGRINAGSQFHRLFDSVLYRLTPSWVSSFLYCRRNILGLREVAREILDKSSPDLLVVEDDRRLSLIPLVYEAKRRGCRILIIPYGFSSVKKSLLVERQSHPDKLVNVGDNRPLKRFVATLWPKAASGQDFEKAFFYRLDETLALTSLSMLPGDPFLLGNWSDLILVGGKFDHQTLLADGVSQEKLVITGEIEHDDLAKTEKHATKIKNELIIKYRLNPEGKIIIVSIPQVQPEELMSFSKQKAERHRLVGAACGFGRNVLLSLHPKLNPHECLDLISDLPVSILTEKLKDVLAAADMYVCNHSSTVRWSIMLNIPTVLVDFNGSEERSFRDLGSALTVCNMDELENRISNLLLNLKEINELYGYQKQVSEIFGILDMGSGARILDATLRLIDRKSSRV